MALGDSVGDKRKAAERMALICGAEVVDPMLITTHRAEAARNRCCLAAE